MVREEWFPTNIWVDEIDNINDEKLKKFCLETEQKYKSVKKSNIGGWQSKPNIIFDEEFLELRNEIYNRLFVIANELNFHDNIQPKITNGWININRKGDFNRSHFHNNSDLSCVYYVESHDENSIIEFYEPRLLQKWSSNTKLIKESNNLNSEVVQYTPFKGKLLIFPSWLEHYVAPSNTNKPRISIAINLTWEIL